MSYFGWCQRCSRTRMAIYFSAFYQVFLGYVGDFDAVDIESHFNKNLFMANIVKNSLYKLEKERDREREKEGEKRI